jgi:hypothetical protein
MYPACLNAAVIDHESKLGSRVNKFVHAAYKTAPTAPAEVKSEPFGVMGTSS